MSKTKKSNLLIIIVIFVAILISLLLFSFLFKNTALDKNDKLSFSVCYAPENCKTITGVPEEAVANIIGYPKDNHRENSNTYIDIQANFTKGRFDEKSFYFFYEEKVYYFINAKILTGFSEDAGLLIESQTETFELIDANFSKDSKNVYGKTDLNAPIAYKIIAEADPETFTPLDWPYAKDKKNIYYLNAKIEDADPISFKILDNKLCGADKNNYYKDGQIVNNEACQLIEAN